MEQQVDARRHTSDKLRRRRSRADGDPDADLCAVKDDDLVTSVSRLL